MVGFTPEQRRLNKAEYAVAGALSGVFTRFVIQPLDVVKIRFQLQVEPISRSGQSKYYSVAQAFGSILREEGITALWKGHVPAQALSVIFGVSQFVTFEVLTMAAWTYLPQKYTTTYRPLTHTLCGGVAGSVASITCHPCDVIRTRLIAQGTPKVYMSMTHAVRVMLRQEGAWSLYRGLGPTLLAIGPQAGLQFGFYTLFKDLWKFLLRHASLNQAVTGPMESLVCGSAAGFCAKLVIYPLDLTKKRLEVQGFGHGRASFGRTDAYTGLWHCLRVIAQHEGLHGLYKGLSPSLIKAAVSSACIFFSYEQICTLMALAHGR